MLLLMERNGMRHARAARRGRSSSPPVAIQTQQLDIVQQQAQTGQDNHEFLPRTVLSSQLERNSASGIRVRSTITTRSNCKRAIASSLCSNGGPDPVAMLLQWRT